jgi:cytochrome d ubiquinol oxidase subunit I
MPTNELISLARLQFGLTSIYHFLFVPLTIGLSLLIAIMETIYVVKGDEEYKKMTKFWGKLFLINFALGVATGIVQEFHFGMAWSGFSKFIGDVLGAPLAIEALAAFFTESVFLGIWIFGWDKVSKKVHLATIWLASISGMLSAFWILVVNTFMQDPSGFVIKNNRAEMTDFYALITSPHLWLQFPHTLMSGIATGSIFVLGISSYHLLKKNHPQLFKKSIKIALASGLISLILLVAIGDLHAKYLLNIQPMKMAAAEAIWEAQEPAGLNIFAIINEKERKNDFELAIPGLLSFMDYSNFTSKVEGINDIQTQYEKKFGPGNYIPPVWIVFLSFRAMVGSGFVMLLFVLITIFLVYKRKLETSVWFLRLLLLIIPLPYISNTAGWLLTETGRQPWAVQNVLLIKDAVSSSLSPGTVLFSLVGFLLIYGFLAVIDLYLIVKFAKLGPDSETHSVPKNPSKKEDSLWI